MVTTEMLKGGTLKIKDRALKIHSGRACDLRLMEDMTFVQTGKEKSGFDLYQHSDGFAILVKRDRFDVMEYKGGKITIKRIEDDK